MLKRPPIPERFLSLMSESRRKTLLERKERHRTISQSSKISTNSTVSEFLEAKVKDLSSEMDYLKDYRNGLLELDSTATPADPEFATTVTSAMKRLREREDELLVIKRPILVLTNHLISRFKVRIVIRLSNDKERH